MADTVFGTSSQTETATSVPDAGADNHIPIQGSAANWGAITSDNFLAGPYPGQEQTLIKTGDQTTKVATGQQLQDVQNQAVTNVFEGDDRLYYHKNHTHYVAVNENYTVKGSQEIAVEQDRVVKVTQNITESGNLNVTIEAGVELVLQGPGGSIKIDASGVTIQGVLVKIN